MGEALAGVQVGELPLQFIRGHLPPFLSVSGQSDHPPVAEDKNLLGGPPHDLKRANFDAIVFSIPQVAEVNKNVSLEYERIYSLMLCRSFRKNGQKLSLLSSLMWLVGILYILKIITKNSPMG